MPKRSLRTTFVLPVLSLWRREVVRFVRQRSRLVGALATPIVFWVLIGSGLRNSFRLTGAEATGDSMDYLEYAFPGTMAMIVLFTAIFATISIIEDRREGFLQAVIAAPVRRSAIVCGKVLGSATLAVVQALLFLLLAPLTGVPLTVGSFAAVLGVLVIVAIGLSALGFLIAWPMDSTQGFHAIMNLVLLPMWMLSGALFPASGASNWLAWIMAINPLTYGVAALRQAVYLDAGGGAGAALPSFQMALTVSVGFAVLMVALSAKVVSSKG